MRWPLTRDTDWCGDNGKWTDPSNVAESVFVSSLDTEGPAAARSVTIGWRRSRTKSVVCSASVDAMRRVSSTPQATWKSISETQTKSAELKNPGSGSWGFLASAAESLTSAEESMTEKRGKKPKYKVLNDLDPLLRPIASVCMRPDNSNEHDERSIAALRESLRRFGQRKPLVVQEATNEIEAGNGTYQAALDLGWTHVAVVFADDENNTATAYHAVDNRTGDFRKWNLEVLRQQLEDIEDVQPEWWNTDELNELVSQLDELDVKPSPPRPRPGAGRRDSDEDGEDSSGELRVPAKDPNILVRLSFHPGLWLGKREEILGVVEQMQKAYNAKVDIKE